uniref:Flavin-containing monooxygenase n=1 Tax=Lactuca sativa TaxID=4236 RepID=A0A9R1VNC8_LACSA|nr:hypothetical protein LSAT_V11C400185040 [Lactuca sativa]
MDYSAMDHERAKQFVKGKRVVVVGFQKQGLDIAMECSSENGPENPCTIVYRKDRWKMSDFSPWGIPLQYLYLNRFSELMVHKPGEGFLLGMLATLLSPLRWGISKLVETHIKKNLPLAKFNMVPERSFSNDMRSCLLAAMPKDFFNRVETGRIHLQKSPGFGFYKDGIVVDGGNKQIQTDIVILATGFKGIHKLKNIFTSQDFRHFIAVSPDSRVSLYSDTFEAKICEELFSNEQIRCKELSDINAEKSSMLFSLKCMLENLGIFFMMRFRMAFMSFARECIQPRIPQLAVIGFSESFSNLFTSEIRCRWVVELLDGGFKLPSIEEMEKDISNWDDYMKKSSGEYYQRSCITALDIWYNDQLCKDMGWNPRRKKGFWADLFQPYGPMDYANP